MLRSRQSTDGRIEVPALCGPKMLLAISLVEYIFWCVDGVPGVHCAELCKPTDGFVFAFPSGWG